MLWRFLAVEPCAKSRTELTLFDITRMIEAHSIREMFILCCSRSNLPESSDSSR
jgi:hypothetical protein